MARVADAIRRAHDALNRCIALLASLLAFSACDADRVPLVSPPPNVLIYLVDTLRADHLSLYGYERETSPRLEEFARDAVVCDTAYSPTSWTRPAIGSLLSGLNPRQHGAEARSSRLDPRVPLLGDFLRPAGYESVAFSTNPNVLPEWGFDRGFEHFYDVDPLSFKATADEVNRVVFQHLGTSEHEPFLLYVHTLDPHAPHDPPAPFDALWRRAEHADDPPEDVATAARARVFDTLAAYDAEIAFNDQQFGVLIDRLKADGLYDDALIVYTADHGEEFWDHGSVGHGRALYQESVRIPLVVKFPANRNAGARVGSVCSLLDVVPTVLQEARQPLPDGLAGRPLQELVGSQEPIERPLFLHLRNTGISEDREIADGVIDGPYKLLVTTEPRAGIGLFDLAADPKEHRSVFREHRDVGVRLRGLLAAHQVEGSDGVHLWVVNAGDEVDRVANGVLRSTTGFAGLRVSNFEPGDEARVEDDGKTLRFRLQLRNFPNPVGDMPDFIVDHDEIVFQLTGQSDDLRVEELRIGDEAATIYGGPGKAGLGQAPLDLSLSGSSLVLPRADSLLEEGIEKSIVDGAGAYFGVVGTGQATAAQIEPGLRERLKRLGYVE